MTEEKRASLNLELESIKLEKEKQEKLLVEAQANKYHDMDDLELFFYEDHISYQPYASVSKDVYTLYKK